MGDRGHFWIKDGDGDPGVFLYGHSLGSALPDILYKALARGRDRWSDCAYLTRIFFCQMMMEAGEPLDGLTGFGIGTILDDSDYPVIVVDTVAWAVELTDGDGDRQLGELMSFDDIVRSGGECSAHTWGWLRALAGLPEGEL